MTSQNGGLFVAAIGIGIERRNPRDEIWCIDWFSYAICFSGERGMVERI